MERDQKLGDRESAAGLNSWQRFHIYANRDTLINRIRFNDKLLKCLARRGITCRFLNFHYLGVWIDYFTNLAHLCNAEGATYDGIIASLQEANQYDAAETLKEGCPSSAKFLWSKTRFGRLCFKMGSDSSLEALKKEFDPEDHKECWFDQGEGGVTLLHVAVALGRVDVVRHLISVGLPVNARDKSNRTPLHCLGFSGRHMLKVTQALYENGADIFAVDTNRYTVAHFEPWCNFSTEEFHQWVSYILEKGHGDIFQMKGTDEDTLLHRVVQWLDISKDTWQLILTKSKLDINILGGRGDTILLRAAFFGRSVATLKNLVDSGAKWDVRNVCGVSVLHCTVAAGNEDATQHFLEKGANVNARDQWNMTPLHMVAYSASSQVNQLTKILLENKADVYASDVEGNTVAHLIDWCGISELEEQLSWKDFVIGLGHSKLFQEENKHGRLPLP